MSLQIIAAIFWCFTQSGQLKQIVVPFKQIEVGGFSRQREERVFVIRSADEFKAYADITGRNTTAQSFNWTKNEVLAIHIGSAPSTGYGVTVKRLLKTGPTTVEIDIVKSTPPPGMMQAMHVTYPFVSISIGRLDPKTSFHVVTVPMPSVEKNKAPVQ